MPEYTYICKSEECGLDFDVYMSFAEYDENKNVTLCCCECGADMYRAVSAIPTVGITWSKPMVIKQIGQTFHSNEEMRRYFEQRPHLEIQSPDSAEWRQFHDGVKEDAEASARKMGFNDRAHEKRVLRHERDRRKGVKDGKIYSRT
jgi:Na+-translocating ferredoxin:NAD+ oxidoreductase RnfC subunit